MRLLRRWLILAAFAGAGAMAVDAAGAPPIVRTALLVCAITLTVPGLTLGLLATTTRRPAPDAASATRALIGTIAPRPALTVTVRPRQALEGPRRELPAAPRR